MGWTRADGDDVEEWERSDGRATIRLRGRSDGSYVVRFDRLNQAPEGSGYRRETVDAEADARALVADWRDRFDVDGE